MKPIYPITYILSSNDINKLEEELNKEQVPTKRVIGRYKGVEETSLVAVTDRERLINSLAKSHNQESVLKLDMTRLASLLYTNGKVEVLGEFIGQASKPNTDYTYDGKQYFVIKGVDSGS